MPLKYALVPVGALVGFAVGWLFCESCTPYEVGHGYQALYQSTAQKETDTSARSRCRY
jgi:hypothetical protein